jgi:hypothetical protein
VIGAMSGRAIPAILALAALLAAPAALRPAFAEGRSVSGKVARLSAEARTLSVKDSGGTVWNFTVDRDAGIDLRRFRAGDAVEVTIGRATPLNMSTVADRIRKGDRLLPAPPRAAKPRVTGRLR